MITVTRVRLFVNGKLDHETESNLYFNSLIEVDKWKLQFINIYKEITNIENTNVEIDLILKIK